MLLEIAKVEDDVRIKTEVSLYLMEDNELVDVKLEDYENEREEFQCYEVEEEIVIGSDGEIEVR